MMTEPIKCSSCNSVFRGTYSEENSWSDFFHSPGTIVNCTSCGAKYWVKKIYNVSDIDWGYKKENQKLLANLIFPFVFFVLVMVCFML